VVVANTIFVSGMTGFDSATMTISPDIVEQMRQCLANIEIALKQANATMADVVCVRYMLPSAEDFPKTGPTLREVFGEIRPATTMFEARLADPRMKIEIEVQAVIRANI